MNRYVNLISNRLSLRTPQRDSLEILARVTEIIKLKKDNDLLAVLDEIQKEFPTVSDFERSFPSICFALATGVGKTRLMGAFIAYLHLVHGIENFFVLAPGLTIYNKLISDFTPGTPKYVFKGIAEFAVTPPTIITGDTYNDQAGTLFDSLINCRINVFNISKINSEVRGGKLPKIKQLSEYIGQSYFDFLSNLPDLVMLMDESHRYRATAGIRAINDLKPILGLELTATPYVESNKGAIPFNNIIYDYPLSQAMKDGFVKEPAVVTRRDFNPTNMSAESIEEMKISDGIALHEKIKVELKTYSLETNNKIVKPFLLIIARDTSHASQLIKNIQSDEFFNGIYKHKVIQVDSSSKEDEVIERLLRVEDASEPTEIVIHVNMLKEGWDVTNLYTIIPLRAANARTLIEQSIGRGLRLPFGKRTGISEVDTLNIIAHDKFQEIIDEARNPNSTINLKSIVLDTDDFTNKSITIISKTILEDRLGEFSDSFEEFTKERKDVFLDFNTSEDYKIAKEVYQVIRSLENKPDLVPNSSYLQNNDIKKYIIDIIETQQVDTVDQINFQKNKSKIVKIVSNTIKYVQNLSIDIPSILEVPKGNLQVGFKRFNLNLQHLKLNIVSEDLWIQSLRTGELHTISRYEATGKDYHFEDIIVESLIEFNDISYEDHAELLYDIAKQCVAYLSTSFLENDIYKILKVHRKLIADNIHEQMLAHSSDISTDGYEVKISRGFTQLKPSAYTTSISDTPIDFKIAPREKNNISKLLYTGFKRCLYEFQKFESNQERILSIILDRESQKWFRPANGQFPIYYNKKGVSSQYEPDFVAETSNLICMLECKDKTEIDDSLVIAKKDAAVKWCKHASLHSNKYGGKPWIYALIPHNSISENKTLDGLINEYGNS